MPRFEKGNQAAKGKTRPPLTNEEANERYSVREAAKLKTKEAFAVILALTKSRSEKIRISAANIIIERAEGKPIQPTKELPPNESYPEFIDKMMEKRGN